MTGTRAVIAAAGVALVLGVGACSSDDPEPRVAPTPSGAVETTGAVAPQRDSPVDRVNAWVDAQNEALLTGDSSDARALATPDCHSCDGLIDPIDRVYQRGGHFETDGWRVDRAKQVSESGNKATVKAAVTIAGGTSFPSKDADPVDFDLDRSIMVFKLVQGDAGWQIAFIGFLS